MIDQIVRLGSVLLIAAGLLLPGVVWAKAARWPLPWFAGGVISALGLFSGVLLLGAMHVPVTGLSLCLWQAAIAISGYFLGQRSRAEVTTHEPGKREWWIALPVLPMIAVAIWRATTQPLSGADVDFRWNYLAEIIVSTGGLEHYPAFSSTDFAQYFWPDGIAPMVSSLYAWTYLAAGSTDKIWTAIPVLLQLTGLLALLWALGRLWGGDRGGWFACALGGATMLLQFALNLGQETGLTALGVGGMAYYLTLWERTRRNELLLPAAACAALVAVAREYGIIFPMVGIVWILSARAGWRKSVGFACGSLLLPALWHLRNWVRTGNPFYAHDVAGIFPVNEAFVAWMRGYSAIYGDSLRLWSGWLEVGRLGVITFLPSVLGLFSGMVLWRRKTGWIGTIALVTATVVCWLVSVPYTAGGLFYSMRVLSPVLVLGCTWGGAVLAQWIPAQRHLVGLLIGLGLFAIDASLRAWTIPLNPYTSSPHEWPRAGYRIQQEFARTEQPFLESLAHDVPGRVLSDSAGAQGIFRQQGKDLIPFWSPEVDFLRISETGGDSIARLRALGFTHVLLKRAQFSMDYLVRTGIWQQLEAGVSIERQNPTYVWLALHGGATNRK